MRFVRITHEWMNSNRAAAGGADQPNDLRHSSHPVVLALLLSKPLGKQVEGITPIKDQAYGINRTPQLNFFVGTLAVPRTVH
jgi:hypothetical protein